jgi:subtilase family serine protease
MKRFLRNILSPLLLSLAFPALGQPALQRLHDHVPAAVSSGEVVMLGALPPTQSLDLAIVLPLRNQAELDNLLGDLYDRSSPSFRKFLSVAQFTERFGPTVEDYRAVVDFARASGCAVTDLPVNRLIVPITCSVEQIESALNVNMNVYRHPTEDRFVFSVDREPSLHLATPIEHISGLSNFSVPRAAVRKTNGLNNTTGSGPSGNFLASDMRAAYYGGTTLTGVGQCVGLAEFDGYYISDVVSTFDGTASETQSGNNYTLSYTPKAGGGTYKIAINNVLLNGASLTPLAGDTDSEAEVVLDIVQPIGMAPGLSQVRVYIVPDAWTTSGNYVFPSNSGDTVIFNKMVSENACSQLSISWNWRPESITSNDGAFKQMAAQGQAFFAASGDSGSWPNGAYYYPEEDANVTAVGGTDLTTNGAGGAWSSETAWSDSGGGISPDGVPIPSYQSGLNGVNGTSKTLRNAPDVAMEANFDNYVCAFSSCQGGWGGTSFATPRWAGYMALANQNSYPVIGFINPIIYPIGEGSSYHTDFHDITSGSNGAFSAAAGYDLVTGWGSPNGPNLITALIAGAPRPPWSFASGLPSNSCNYPSNWLSFSLRQQYDVSSLQWSESTSLSSEGSEIIIQLSWSWTLSDKNGELLSGSGLGTENLTAPRAPVGTPTVSITGYALGEGGCYANLQENLTGTN